LDSLGVCLQPLIGVHYHLSIPFLHSSLFFIHPIRNLASIGIRARLANKDQIGKLELAFQKLAEETKKQFDDLEKSLENIASSLKKGFSGSDKR